MVIQVVVTVLIVLIILPNIYGSYKQNILGAFLWAIFWIVAMILIWFPHLIGIVGDFFGVERSIDALVYLAIVFLLYTFFQQKIQINKINHEITKLSRNYALSKIKTRNEKDT